MQYFGLAVVLGLSLWVVFDAKKIGVEKGRIKGLFDMGVTGWFFSCMLLPIVAFPAYLVKRSAYKQAEEARLIDPEKRRGLIT